MDRIFLDQFRRDHFAVQALLQHVEGLHPAVAQHQQFAVDRAGQMQRRQQVRKALGDVFAGARIEPRQHVAALVAAADRLHANAVPFPFRDEIGGVEIGKIRILDRMRQHHRAERRRIEIDRLFGAAFQPREQIEIGRGEPGPHQFDLVRILVAERGGGGLGQPRRDPDPHRAGDEFQQRPAAGLVEFVEPARELLRQFGLAERAQRGDDFGEGRRRRVVVAGGSRSCAVPSSHPLAQRGEGSGVGGGSASSLPDECADRPPTPLDSLPTLRGRAGRGVAASLRDRSFGHISATVSERSPT